MDPTLIGYLSALSTPTVAAFAGYIAYRQWRTANTKLRFDLFDRRVKVYEAAQAFIASIARTGKVTEEALFQFSKDVVHTRWLFNDQVDAYLRKELYEKALQLQCIESELEVLTGLDRGSHLKARRDLKSWFYKQFDALENVMTPLLQIDQLPLYVRWWRAIPMVPPDHDYFRFEDRR